MNTEKIITAFFEAMITQNKSDMADLLDEQAKICWHCTNEVFTKTEYLRANCEYPGKWKGQIERIVLYDTQAITAARVWNAENSFHVTSFYQLQDNVITGLDEYWGDDGPPPAWRLAMKIGHPIK